MDALLLVQELQKEMPGEFVAKDIDVTQNFSEANKYGVQSTPQVVVLDGAGNVISNDAGVPEKADLKAKILKAEGDQ